MKEQEFKKVVKAIGGMSATATRNLATLTGLQAVAKKGNRLPLTETEFIFVAKYLCNSDTDVTGTTATETSRKVEYSLFTVDNGFRLKVAAFWRNGNASLDAEKVFKTLQRGFQVAPTTAPVTTATGKGGQAVTTATLDKQEAILATLDGVNDYQLEMEIIDLAKKA